MAEIIHKVIGAGDKATNPIIVNLDCETSAGTISWVGREMLSDNCGCNKYYDNRYYTEISGETEHVKTHTWEGVPVYYESKLDCPSEEEETCSECFCSDLSAYAVPSHVKEGFSGRVEINYEYYLTCKNQGYTISPTTGKCSGGIVQFTASKNASGDNEKICSREKITGIKEIEYPEDITNNMYILDIGDGCSQKTIFFTTYKDDGTCTENTTIELSVTTSTNEVSWNGETISVIYSFVKTKTNEDCSTKKISGSIYENWVIPECSSPSEDKPKYCCEDNDITSSTTVGNVITNLGLTLGGNEVIIYDGEQVGTEKVITYSVTQKAKTTDECQSTCEAKTTYCVDSNSVEVYYDVNGEWVIEGVVPEEGGRIMLKFSGTATTILSDCSEYDNNFSREIIIDVPSCHRKTASAPYVYYFTDGEQTVGCETCEGGTKEDGTIIYNKITYDYNQPCNGCYRIEPTSGLDCDTPTFTATPL